MRRILLFGPPLSGKATTIMALADRVGFMVQAFDAPTLGWGVPVARGLRAKGVYDGRALEVLTYPGAVWDERCWDDLAGSSDAAALVLDSQPSRREANATAVAQALALGSFPMLGCVMLTKQDIFAGDVETGLSGTSRASWPEYRTRVDQAEGLLAPIAWLARAV